MKRIGIILLLLTFSIYQLNAQEIAENTIGIRLGDNDGFGAEVSYQRAVGDNNRLEFGLGVRNNSHLSAFKLIGMYQWVWNIDGGFNWYAGPGAGVGQINYDENFPKYNNRGNETFAFVAGDIGIEYSFDFPLLLSLDFRPELGFGEFRKDVIFDIGVAARYQF